MGKHHRRKMYIEEINALKLTASYFRGRGRRPRQAPRAESGTARRRRKAVERSWAWAEDRLAQQTTAPNAFDDMARQINETPDQHSMEAAYR